MDCSKTPSEELFLSLNLKFLRAQLKMSQEELASKIGLNRGNIASYENGTAEPKICNLLKLSQLFGVTIAELTQKDLTSGNLPKHEIQSPLEIESLYEKAAHLGEVMKSLRTCCLFKKMSVEEVSPDAQVIFTHFEQLYEASLNLLDDHHSLLNTLRKNAQ
jgi:transcriptional regulator with XRE-family HTH domain